jgi:hypothetical protein
MCATIDRWDRKCSNWALWAVSGSRTSTSNMFRVARGWNEGAPANPPALVGEAFDVDSLIVKLSREQHQAIVVWYTWTGTLKLRAVQACVLESTLRDRRRAAIFKLDDLNEARKRAVVLPPAQNTRARAFSSVREA